MDEWRNNENKNMIFHYVNYPCVGAITREVLLLRVNVFNDDNTKSQDM